MSRERVFNFKHFSVQNHLSAMKVGTDGILLGAWCDTNSATRVLDVGTGCGLIALMIAQRNQTSAIDAIDIDADAITEAVLNFEQSPWKNRLHAERVDFNDYVKKSAEKFDLIVSNPPFFTNGILPPSQQRTNARHTTLLTFENLIKGVKNLLSKDGKFAMVSPVESFKEIVEYSYINNLNISKMVKVKSRIDKVEKRMLWELTLQPCETIESELIIEQSPAVYSREFVELCKDFYLKF